MTRLLLAASYLLIHTALSQSVCVSGATEENSLLNGLYTSIGTWNGKSYYKKTAPGACYTYYIYWDNNQNQWLIDEDLDTYYINSYCTSSSLSNCNSNWYIVDYTSYTFAVDYSVSSVFGSCPPAPIWQCDTISIPSLYYGCEQLFDVHLDDNVWSNSANTMFWYWNEWSFRWQCDNEHPDYGQCSNSYYGWTAHQWVDISGGQSKSLTFEYPDSNSHTVYCIMDPTPYPTQKPTNADTSHPSFKPTSMPTDAPATVPSRLPTETPTDAPSTVPSGFPASMPTVAPTAVPSRLPTETPTDAPSTVPSGFPASMPTVAPTAVPSRFPNAAPFTVPFSLPTETPFTLPTPAPTRQPTDFKEGKVREITTLAMVTDSGPPNNDGKSESTSWVAVYVSLAMFVICLVCVVMMRLYYRKINNAEENQNKMSHLVQRKTSVNKQAVADKPKTNVMELQVPVAKNDDDEKDEPGAIIGDGGESFGITEGEDEGQRAELKEWMVEKVKLPQYYDTLVMNG
eukprot:323545_1